MITYISLSSDKKYLIIDVNTESALKIQLEGDVTVLTSDNKIEYIITETKCRLILIQDEFSTSECTTGQMVIYSENMSYIDRYEDYGPDTTGVMLAKAIDLYKQERL